MQESKDVSERADHEAQQFIHDAGKLVIDSAAQGAAVCISQSFSGSDQTCAIVVCLVACPEALVLQLQEAIDETVERTLGNLPVLSIN